MLYPRKYRSFLRDDRGYVTIEICSEQEDTGQPALIWIEELIDVAESSASAPVYALLKRDDLLV